jgi:hypothetical protein
MACYSCGTIEKDPGVLLWIVDCGLCMRSLLVFLSEGLFRYFYFLPYRQ